MTAVLAATDVFRRDPVMAFDDIQVDYSSPQDWRAKYEEVADMLTETRAELDEFHVASKELEQELENELQRTEKAQQDLKVKVARAESEREDWKNKFMAFQTKHNSTTTSLQRELDQLRQELQKTKVQLRELEMGNDDLERTERAVSSSLADAEAKYSRALEEKILLEHELIDKANLEEQCQRFKDELRDATTEISILKDQISALQNAASTTSVNSTKAFNRSSISSLDDLLHTAPPSDLQLSELDPSPVVERTPNRFPAAASDRSTISSDSDEEITPRKRFVRPAVQSSLSKHPNKPIFSTPPSASTSIPRSTTIPSFNSPRTPSSIRSPVMRNPSTMSNSSVTSTASKSKGVQMASAMRARVENLGLRIHTKVPRLRSASKANSNALTTSSITNGVISPTIGKSALAKSSWESALSRRSNDSQRSGRSQVSDKSKKEKDSSGWVLIMEDSPSPPKDREKLGRDRRRTSSPFSASTFGRPTPSSSPPSKPPSLYQSTTGGPGIRRPQSRLSAGSTTTTSSIPTPSSRPATPTYLPLPTSSISGLKRSTTFSKRSSLGKSTMEMPPPPVPNLPNSPTIRTEFSTGSRAIPPMPDTRNVTTRRPAPSASAAALSKSRIGRPSGGNNAPSRRRSSEDTDRMMLSELTVKAELRPRSGSSANFYKS